VRGERKRQSLEIAPHESGLWDSLRSTRARLAREQGVPAYVIFHDATLLEMLREQPQTLDQLGAISGVGAAKLNRYGQAFLQALANP
jgi:ATP-dependent DNA helicase RecQ